MSDEVSEALEQVARIVEMIDDEVPESARDRAPEFFDDVRRKVVDVGETIEARGRVTDKQRSALDGWERGVAGWIK